MLNDALEPQQRPLLCDLKTLVVAAIYLTLEFLQQEQTHKPAREPESPGAAARAEALRKYRASSASCAESEAAKEERLLDYREYSHNNPQWWTVHFNITEPDLVAACDRILSVYEA